MSNPGESSVLGTHGPGQSLYDIKREKRRQKSERFISKLEKRQKFEGNSSTTAEPAAPSEKDKNSETSRYTLSIAIPCSIIDNALTLELKCYLAAQVARALAIYSVDEVVIFNDTGNPVPASSPGEFVYAGKKTHSAVLLAGILQYLECPAYLRKLLFPSVKEFDFAESLNPLHMPYHSTTETLPFREGIVTNRPVKAGKGSYVNVGLKREVQVDRSLEPGIRVTVRMSEPKEGQKKHKGTVVSPAAPRLESGVYWGYTVRIANTFNQVFADCPYGKNYDLTVGTSENGYSVDDLKLKPFKNLLVLFGGVKGLEDAVEADETLKATTPEQLFTHYVNTCPLQGSRTIRTEEAVLISLASIQPAITACLSK